MIDLPQSKDTEAAVLRAWLTQPAFGAGWRPDPALFSIPPNRVLADVCRVIETRDEAAVLAEVTRRGSLDAVGGAQGIFRAFHLAPSCDDPWPHVRRLEQYAALRSLLAGLDRARAIGSETTDLDATVSAVQEALRFAAGVVGARPVTVAEMFTHVVEDLLRTDRPVARAPSGIPALDRDTGGLRPGVVAVVGAETSWGKSSLGVMIADESLRAGRGVLVVSFEDDERLYGRRLIARRARVNAFRLREKQLMPDEMDRVSAAHRGAESLPVFLDGRGRSAERVVSDIRSLCASDGIDIVLVDYLQAVTVSATKQDRRNEVAHVARLFTDVIKQSGAAGVLFSQLRRLFNADRPTMHTLKESGELENAAEIVMLGYRTAEGAYRIVVDKCKDGACGEYDLAWDSNACCFLGGRSVGQAVGEVVTAAGSEGSWYR